MRRDEETERLGKELVTLATKRNGGSERERGKKNGADEEDEEQRKAKRRNGAHKKIFLPTKF